MRTWGPLLAGTVVLLAGSTAFADTCPVPEGGSAKLATIDAQSRIDFLHRTGSDQARYARTWKWAWFGIGAATFAASGIQAIAWAAGNDKTREANVIDNVVVTGFSLVTPVTALLFALRVETDAPIMDELLMQTGGASAGSCLVLARMEELFEKDAADEANNTGVLAHVIALVGLGAMFAVMAVQAAVATDPDIRDAHWINAITNTAAGLVITEGQLLTTPTGAVSAYRRYLKGDLPQHALGLSIVPLVTTPGVGLKISF